MSTLVEWFLAAVPLIGIVAAIVGAASLILAAWRARSSSWRSALGVTLVEAMLLLALAAIVVLTLGEPMGSQPDRVNLVPFRDQWWALQGQVDPALGTATLAANVVLFIPLGAALAARFPGASAWGLTLVAASVSVSVEVAQAALDSGRLADVTDVMANAAGAWLGVLLWRALAAGGKPNERSA